MSDRRVSAGIVLLGGVLTGVGCALDVFATRYEGPQETSNSFDSLWGTTTDAPGYPDFDITMAAGLPVVLAAVVMVLAAVCTLAGERIAGVARVVTMVGAGALFGVVLVFVVEVLYRNALLAGLELPPEYRYEQTVLPGLYLLVAGALVGLAGAVLVQRSQPAVEVPVADDDTSADDDTPPFGIAVPVESKGD
jgi:uncharacterized membrane protein YedE/YeeE